MTEFGTTPSRRRRAALDDRGDRPVAGVGGGKRAGRADRGGDAPAPRGNRRQGGGTRACARAGRPAPTAPPGDLTGGQTGDWTMTIFDHFGIQVSDFEKLVAFYEAALAPL